MTAHTPNLRAVQNDVIEPIEPTPTPVSDLSSLADKLLSASTTEIEIAEQILGFLERGVDRSVRNQWVDEIVKRTHHMRGDVSKLAKRVEADFLRKVAEAETDNTKGPLIGAADFKDLLEHGRKRLIAAVDAFGSPRVVSYMNCPSEIMEQDDGTVVIHQLSRDEFAEILDEVAEFHELNSDGDIINVPATKEIVSRLYSRARSGMFPVLKGLLHTPCLLPSGLLLKPGLDLESGYYLHPSVEVADLPEVPSDDGIEDAKFLLCHDLFGDAMLGGVTRKDIARGVIPPGLANAVGLLVTYFARPAIAGGTPIWMLTKPAAGSGASTLMGGISQVALGTALTTVRFQHDDDNLAKYLLGEVRAGVTSICFDNVTGSVDSPSLAQATTSGILRGRMLGQTKIVQAPWRAIVSFTGNRPDLSEELVSRACALDFDPSHADPQSRNFQHENYADRVKTRRVVLTGERAAVVVSAMAHLAGYDRSQLLLLPEAVDDYVGSDNPVRFIEAFVGELDLGAAGFARVVPKAVGRPGYDPADLLKLYIYGYLNRVRSSRRLEVETHRNVEVIWLLRGLKPDFKTIADFRRDNRAAFRPVFRAFVVLCRQLDLFGRELLAVDGTRIKAVNNKDRNFTRAALTQFVQQADEKLAGYLKRLDEGDADEEEANVGGSGPGRKDPRLAEKIAAVRGKRERHQALLDELDRTGEDQISLTDPDSRAMARMTKVGVGYNVQVAVDVKHKLIVEQEVHSQVVDMGLLAATAKAAMEALGVERIEAVADRGYFKIEDIEACEAAGVIPYVPKPVRGSAVREGFFPKEAFRYDPTTDTFTCPGSQTLRPCRRGRSRDNIKVDYSNREACRACQLRPRCTKTYRHVSRLENEAVLDRMAARLAVRPEVLDQRRTCVEHPFGTIKQWMNQGAFLMRRLDNVRGEFSLTALVYNIRRAISLVGVPGLIAAAKA